MDDDEELLWSGRPRIDAVLKSRRHAGPGVPTRMIVVAVTIGGFFWLWSRNFGLEVPATTEEIVNLLNSKAMYPLAAIIGMILLMRLIRGVGWDNESRLERWVRAQSYGLTNRRLLILTGDRIEDELGPEDFAEPRIRRRGNGYDDIELKVKSSPTGQRTSSVQREQLRVAFRAIPNAENVKRQIEDWQHQFRVEEEKEAHDFLEGPATPARQAGTAKGVRTLRSEKFGVTLSLPDAWDIKVRKRRKPYGKIFWDLERWNAPEEQPDWNVLKAEGDYLTAFEIHLDHVRKPVMVYQQAKNSTLINAMSGDIVESDDNLRRGAFIGFSITRKHVERRPDQSGHDRNRPALHRWMLLHDGRLQIGITMVWPDDSEPLKRAIDKVFESIRVD